MICEKCGKEFFEDWRKDKQQRKLPMRFCSRSCAASRVRSEEVKQKISLSVANTVHSKGLGLQNYCIDCGNPIRKNSTRCNGCASKNVERRSKISKSVRENPNCGGWHTSKRIKYGSVYLDSAFELEVAKSLDESNIKWERPNFLWWEFEGKKHRYYPDFYLKDYNIFLDPKNDFLINKTNPSTGLKDVEKIKLVEEQNNVKIFILNKDQLNWESIKILAGLV